MRKQSLEKVQLDIPDLLTPIDIGSSNSSGGNKAKIKKMVVADPGLGVLINFEAGPQADFNEIKLHFELGRMVGSQFIIHHEADFSTSINPLSSILFPLDLIFVTPFVDSNFLHEPSEDLYFKLNVSYIKTSIDIHTFYMEEPALVEMLEKHKTLDYNLPSTESYLSQVGPINPIEFSRILFHTDGTAWESSFPDPNTDYSDVFTIVKAYPSGEELGSHDFEAVLDNITTTSKAITWIPAINTLANPTYRDLNCAITNISPPIETILPAYPSNPQQFEYISADVVFHLVPSI